MRRCLILYGITCIVGQVLALREMAVLFHGNELVYGAALAVWLALTAIGSGLLGRLAVRCSLGATAFLLTLAAGGLLVPVTILLARLVRHLMIGGAGVAPALGPLLLAILIVLAPLCLTLGFFYALACVIGARSGEPAPKAASRVYVYEALGTFIGGVLLTAVLLTALDSLPLGIALAALNTFSAFVLWWHSPHRARYWGWTLALLSAALVALVALPLPATRGGEFISPAQLIDFMARTPRFPGSVLQMSEDTPYGRVEVVRSKEQVEFYESGALAGASHIDRATEERALLPLLAHPGPQRVLVIGGLANGVVRKVLDAPAVQVDAIELDPALALAVCEYADVKDREALRSPRLTLYTDTDARRFIRDRRGVYDVILSAAPGPSTGLLNRLYTEEFFRQAGRALKRGGVFAFTLDGSPAYLNTPHRALAASLYVTARRCFGTVALVPGDSAVYYLAASTAGPSFPDAPVWSSRLRAWNVAATWLTDGALRELANPSRSADLVARLREVKAPALNSDLRPVAYYQALLLWVEAFQVKGAQLLNWALDLDLWDVLMGVALLAGLAAIAATFARRPIAVGLPVAWLCAGMAGLVIEMVLVLAYQALYGCTYGQMGMLFASFMVGLTVGGAVAGRWATDRGDVRMLLVLQMALGVLAAALVPVLTILTGPAAWTARAWAMGIIPLLNFCAGALVGAQYPIAVAAWAAPHRAGGAARTVPASLYAIELVGACIGALFSATILIPALGIPATCWITCALCIASLPVLVLADRKRAG